MAEVPTVTEAPASPEPVPTTESQNGNIPPPPFPRACRNETCDADVEAYWVEPAPFLNRVIEGTGVWQYPEICTDCAARKAAADVDRALLDVIKRAGLGGKLGRANMATCHTLPSESVRMAVTKFANGHANLFLTGEPGRGKTWLAAALLRHDIETRHRQGYFENVPDLMAELREAAGKGGDNALILKLSNAGALVLDDMAVERPTHYALETLYRLIDRWDRQEKKGLIITSNKSLAWISEQLDDRLASRIGGMCEVLELTGPDRRLPS